MALSEDEATAAHRAQLRYEGLGGVRPDNALAVLAALAQGEARIAQQRYQGRHDSPPREDIAAVIHLARERAATALAALDRLEQDLRSGCTAEHARGRAIAIADRLASEAGRVLSIDEIIGGER